METELLQVREYVPADWGMVSGWWSAHSSSRLIVENLLPPLGLVIEQDGSPVMALWVHLSVNIGVAFLESPVMCPGLTLAEASTIGDFALKVVEGVCREHDYGVLICYTLPALARYLSRRGWHHAGNRIQMVKEVQHGN